MRKQLNLKKPFVIGNVGRLCFQKNQSFLIDVFAQIYPNDSSARPLLVGEGEGLEELKEKAMHRSASDVVIFYGTIPYVEKLLWAMDVFVFPSIFEGFGIAAIEAQAAGLPTICSDRVPEEVLASSLAVRIPLEGPPQRWAEVALKAKLPSDRTECAAVVQAAGFDADRTAKWIEKFYLRMDGHGYPQSISHYPSL